MFHCDAYYTSILKALLIAQRLISFYYKMLLLQLFNNHSITSVMFLLIFRDIIFQYETLLTIKEQELAATASIGTKLIIKITNNGDFFIYTHNALMPIVDSVRPISREALFASLSAIT